MNKDNKLKLDKYTHGVVFKREDGATAFVVTGKEIANARVLKAYDDGVITVHYLGNYNTHGDFSSELMTFSSDLVLDEQDFNERNAFRIANGLLPIK